MAAEDIFTNVNATSIATSRTISEADSAAQSWKKFVVGDLRDLNLYFTDGAGAFVDVSAYASIRVGVGGINKRPTGGNWEFTHGGNDHTFDFATSAATMESVLDASPFSLAVSVTSPVTGVYVVKFDAVGAQTLPTSDAYALTPDSTISVKRLVTGDGSTREEWIIRLFQVPWAYSESWSNISDGVTGTLTFATENLYKALGDGNSLTGYFEIELTDASANVTTPIQAPVTITGEVIGDGVAGAGEFASYLTKTYEAIIISVFGESESSTTGGAKVTWRMPYAMTLTGIRSSAYSASTGSAEQYDLNEEGVSVLSTPLTMDAGENTSTTAAVPAVISDSALADDAEMAIDVDTIGSSTATVGLKIYLLGYRT